VIALLEARDPDYVREAARRGIFAYIVDGDSKELQSAIEITLQRFAEYHNLEGAFGRRARIERAKGILMERHTIDEQQAFTILRTYSQNSGRKLIDVAESILTSHQLPPRRTTPTHPTLNPELATPPLRAAPGPTPRCLLRYQRETWVTSTTGRFR
jgi:ANTAR domain